jgi:hypothetical protein
MKKMWKRRRGVEVIQTYPTFSAIKKISYQLAFALYQLVRKGSVQPQMRRGWVDDIGLPV